MSLKVLRTTYNVSKIFSRNKHYTVLPSDTFEGTLVRRERADKKELPLGTYGGRHLVTMLPGDWPGPKLMKYVKDVFATALVPIDFEVIESMKEEDRTHETVQAFTEMAIVSMKRNRVGIKGNIPRPSFQKNLVSSNVTIRTKLDLYVCVVHCRSYKNITCKYPGLDMYIIRQNTEGEYAMLEHETKPGVVESLKIITRENTERLARWTFEFAKMKKRKKVTIVHKANIMKFSDGLFMKTIKDVAKDYPEIVVDDMIVDNCTMQLVQNPQTFDVIVTPNLYGNILSNIVCGLIGGPGLFAGENYGQDLALFEAASRHLSYENMNVVNPVCMLNASVNLLHYIGKHEHANLIDDAIVKTLNENRIHTADIGGSNSSDEVVDTIKMNIREQLKLKDLNPF